MFYVLCIYDYDIQNMNHPSLMIAAVCTKPSFARLYGSIPYCG